MTTQPLFVRPPAYEGEFPFQNDLFNRKALAETLTGYVNRTKEGCVIGLDAPWGEGKSWFGRNWCAKLTSDGHKTIFLDAFEQDYSEDPFTVLAAEILRSIEAQSEQPVAKNLWSASLKLGRTLLPAAAKISINALGKVVLGTQDLSVGLSEVAHSLDDQIAAATEKYVASRLSESEAEKKSVAGFRSALTAYAEAQDKPVVFFIDELDRCRPDFAVRVIERVKHFFDVPNLVFVLLLNRPQLWRAIEGVYGQGFDANAYLGKFVHLFLTLPKKRSLDTGQSNAAWVYTWEVAKRYNFGQEREFDTFVNAFGQLAAAFDLSLRDVEKAIALVALSGTISHSTPYLAWPIVLKLRYPDVFLGLISADRQGHQRAIDLLNAPESGEANFWIRDYYLALHTQYLSGKDSLNDAQKRALESYSPRSYYRDDVLGPFLKKIDVALLD